MAVLVSVRAEDGSIAQMSQTTPLPASNIEVRLPDGQHRLVKSGGLGTSTLDVRLADGTVATLST